MRITTNFIIYPLITQYPLTEMAAPKFARFKEKHRRQIIQLSRFCKRSHVIKSMRLVIQKETLDILSRYYICGTKYLYPIIPWCHETCTSILNITNSKFTRVVFTCKEET